MRDKRGEFLCLFLKNGRDFKLMKISMHWRLKIPLTLNPETNLALNKKGLTVFARFLFV